MIFEILKILSEEINNYYGEEIVLLENISILESNSDRASEMEDKIILTLVNIKEEPTLKNYTSTTYANGLVNHQNPAINLNIFLLFCANRNTYVKSLSDLSKIVSFFQAKKIFTQDNTIYNRSLSSLANVGDFEFRVSLFTPSFEELNYVWGTLGGKQYPSVMYKLSIIQIDSGLINSQSAPVGKIVSNNAVSN